MRGETIRIGIVGACGRGASFKAACDAIPGVRVEAVCDTFAEGLPGGRSDRLNSSGAPRPTTRFRA